MSAAGHSKLPWSFSRPYAGMNSPSGKLCAGETVVFTGYIPSDEYAALIVRAVTSHDALVEALRDLLNAVEAHHETKRGDYGAERKAAHKILDLNAPRAGGE